MSDSQPFNLKFLALKHGYFFVPILFIFWFGAVASYAQQPHLGPELFKEGLLKLKFKDAWRYQPGDNPQWANPDFDDSNWYTFDPIGLKAYAMPDSLWKGYGWWRITFTADPELIKDIERLYFHSWGAAEVYLDGKLVATYGSFSPNSQLEKTHTPDYAPDRPIEITPRDIHTLAVRFSNHQAKSNFKIFRQSQEKNL
jgi:hypothetical protein